MKALLATIILCLGAGTAFATSADLRTDRTDYQLPGENDPVHCYRSENCADSDYVGVVTLHRCMFPDGKHEVYGGFKDYAGCHSFGGE